MEKISPNFSQKIEALLKDLNLNSTELAKRSAMARTTIDRFRLGVRIPQPDVIAAIAQGVGASFEQYKDLLSAANSDLQYKFGTLRVPTISSFTPVNLLKGEKDGYLENGTRLNTFSFMLTLADYPIVYDQIQPDNRLLMETYFRTHVTVKELGEMNYVTRNAITRRIKDALDQGYSSLRFFMHYQNADIEQVFPYSETVTLKNPNHMVQRAEKISKSLEGRVITYNWRRKISNSFRLLRNIKDYDKRNPKTDDPEQTWDDFLKGN